MDRKKITKPWKIYFKAFFVFLFVNMSLGQNTVIKNIDAETISTISIDGNQIFDIDITTSNTNYISCKSVVDGEYENMFQVISNINGASLELKLEQYQYTIINDDKRNAHKVVAVKLILDIPENINLSIVSDIANIKLKGNFDSVNVRLEEGFCNLSGQVKEGIIQTINGDIIVTTDNAEIYAQSNKGKITLFPFKIFRSKLNLKSIKGNINVRQSQ
ncbi:DUF4097 family beta strand repeat-containing protein [Winogradskyella alexanderae]|uniref:Adhesin domain-containing protein n=1 Tax=Winogradskyella alexanderae TaxID=2877123 RepID=A0ABS7XQZ3_9FLAO|nr:hypothetical protein [Winogradskyella alexanderae]MCA0131466.1 hypothetical protein [Winogradskyella alexanderae]